MNEDDDLHSLLQCFPSWQNDIVFQCAYVVNQIAMYGICKRGMLYLQLRSSQVSRPAVTRWLIHCSHLLYHTFSPATRRPSVPQGQLRPAQKTSNLQAMLASHWSPASGPECGTVSHYVEPRQDLTRRRKATRYSQGGRIVMRYPSMNRRGNTDPATGRGVASFQMRVLEMASCSAPGAPDGTVAAAGAGPF